MSLYHYMDVPILESVAGKSNQNLNSSSGSLITFESEVEEEQECYEKPRKEHVDGVSPIKKTCT